MKVILINEKLKVRSVVARIENVVCEVEVNVI
jgi:hypothetical protein